MSYEGLEQFLCPKGHLTEINSSRITYATEEERNTLFQCPHCKQSFIFNCSVDFTNGYDKDEPETFRGKVKEVGYTDVWHTDHYNNRYATKLIEYVPDDPTRWEAMEPDEPVKKAVARFVPPHSDKNWSFQIHYVEGSLPDSYEFTSLFSDPDVEAAKPFLQGHNGPWAMVEFWVKDEAVARKAAEKFAATFKVEMKDGDFTRAELGLD